MKFKNYVEGLDISDVFKKRILNIDFINANPVYYQNYPSLFANVFAIKKSSLDLLNIAGYFCYQSTLYVDDLIDEKELSVFPLISVCQEESIKLLTHLFGLKHPFWELWNSRKNEYFQAVLLEKELFKKEIVTIKEYEILADQKSAFGKVAIDCLYSLDSNCDTTLYEKLHLSHKYFSVAFQLNDDVKDLKEDIVNGQFNWAVALLKKENLTEKDPAILEKYLYLRGISKQMFLLGIEYCDKSLNIVKDIDVPKWKEIVEDFKKAFSKAIYEFENYLEVLVTEINMSKKIVVSNSIKESIPLAIQFIKSKQKDNGSWHEYINQGGISTVWSTSFILSKISANPHLKLVFKKEISDALSFLSQNTINELWDYNTTWTEDADSTNFAFLSYLYNGKKISTTLLNKWKMLFQKENGGFSTYSRDSKILTLLNEKEEVNIKGWLSVHDCVSAVSFYFLANQDKNEESFLRVKSYFDSNFKKLNSYWWTSDIYTYYYLSKTYKLLNEKEKLDSIISKIKEKQNKNGSFSDKYGENYFYTGLALEILLLGDDGNLEKQIKKGVNYLLDMQYTDGSWKESHSLQMPYANVVIPSNTYFPVANYGMNVRANEFGRLFTTAAILNFLTSYIQKYDSGTF